MHGIRPRDRQVHQGAPLQQRRAFLLQLAGLAAVPLFGGCSASKPLAVAIHPWIGYETLHIAQSLRWLPEQVHLHEGASASESLAALKDGRVDAACLTLDEVLRSRAEGVPLTIALVFDISSGADVVMARPAIKTLADLKGKRIGLERSALGALVLASLLKAADLPESAVNLLDLPPDQQLMTWQKGEVDAIITYEPTASLLRREGARRLFDSRQMPDRIFDVLAVRTDRIASRHDTLKGLLVAHFQALEHLRINRMDAIYRIATRLQLEPSEVTTALGGVALPSLRANAGYLAQADSPLANAAATLSKLMVGQGMLPHAPPLDDLFAATWLPRQEAPA